MHLLTLIFGIVLLPAAYALKCYECLPNPLGSCTDTQTECPLAGFKCGTLRITSYAGGSQIADLNMKTCTVPEQCIDGSVNFGIAKTVITSSCCTSDLCNAGAAPAAGKDTPNGKKCYTCNGQSCTATLNCNGSEDHCISATVDMGGEKTTVKGCASAQMCTSTDNAQLKGAIGGDFSCCQGNYCNSASSTSAGLLLLLTPLVSLIVFS